MATIRLLKAPKKLVDIEKNKLDTNKKKLTELEFQYKNKLIQHK